MIRDYETALILQPEGVSGQLWLLSSHCDREPSILGSDPCEQGEVANAHNDHTVVPSYHCSDAAFDPESGWSGCSGFATVMTPSTTTSLVYGVRIQDQDGSPAFGRGLLMQMKVFVSTSHYLTFCHVSGMGRASIDRVVLASSANSYPATHPHGNHSRQVGHASPKNAVQMDRQTRPGAMGSFV
jgi:hypothetical protein